MPEKRNLFIALTITLAFAFCRQGDAKHNTTAGNKRSTENYSSPPGYDLSHPVVFNLRSELDEISGVVFYPKDTSVFAVCDDNGWLYKLHLTGKQQVEKWKFSKGDDFEDLVLKDSTFYVLASSGQITAFKFSGNKPAASNTFSLHMNGTNEFETLYADSSSGKLMMVCKDCDDDPNNSVSGFTFDPSSASFSNSSAFTLNVSDIAGQLGLNKMKFKPSAATINPLTKELYVLSSVNKALVVADKNGNIKSSYNLSPRIYKQPEGITFTPAGDLIISNESADIGAANILIIKLKK